MASATRITRKSEGSARNATCSASRRRSFRLTRLLLSCSLAPLLAFILLLASPLPATAYNLHGAAAAAAVAAATANATGQPDTTHVGVSFRLPANPVIETPDVMLAGAGKLQLAADVAAAAKVGRVGKAVARKFQLWAQKMGKRYEGVGPAEMAKRLLAFAANLAFVEAHNRKHPDQQLKLNEFSDMSFGEFKARNLRSTFNMSDVIAGGGMVAADSGSAGSNASSSAAKRLVSGAQAPASFDWTAYRVVTTAKHQQQCGE